MRLSAAYESERGDTIIEVIFAVAIFALVAVSSLAIMNQGVVTGERVLEVTLVRQQIDAQAESLRYIHDAQLAAAPGSSSVWVQLLAKGQSSASPYGTDGGPCVLPSGSGYKPFILNAPLAQISGTPPTISPGAGANFPPYPQVVYNADGSIKKAYGLWIEAVPSKTDAPTHFVDFHIRACWDGPGNSVPMTLGTIVRLYDPR